MVYFINYTNIGIYLVVYVENIVGVERKLKQNKCKSCTFWREQNLRNKPTSIVPVEFKSLWRLNYYLAHNTHDCVNFPAVYRRIVFIYASLYFFFFHVFECYFFFKSLYNSEGPQTILVAKTYRVWLARRYIKWKRPLSKSTRVHKQYGTVDTARSHDWS